MKIQALTLVGNLLKETFGFFTTINKARREQRLINLKYIISVIKGEKQTRSVAAWIFMGLVLVGIMIDIAVNEGANFDILLALFGAVSGA